MQSRVTSDKKVLIILSQEEFLILRDCLNTSEEALSMDGSGFYDKEAEIQNFFNNIKID